MPEKLTQTHVALLAVWVTVFFGGIQIWQSVRSHREQTVNRVFDMSQEYRANLIDVKLQFMDEWVEYVQLSIEPLPKSEIPRRYRDLVDTFLAKPETHKRYEKLGFFYNMVGECVKAAVCDFDAANTMFGDDVLTYYDDMYPSLMNVCQHGHEVDGILDFIAKKNNKKPIFCGGKSIVPVQPAS